MSFENQKSHKLSTKSIDLYSDWILLAAGLYPKSENLSFSHFKMRNGFDLC